MIVKFYDGCIIKDETKDYKLINKIISNGIIQEFYHSKTKHLIYTTWILLEMI